jgi:hypothetical protein
MKRKYFNQPDRVAKPNQVLEIQKIERIKVAREGTFTDYQVNGENTKKTVIKSTKTDTFGRGMYVGKEGKVTAFVWLDD